MAGRKVAFDNAEDFLRHVMDVSKEGSVELREKHGKLVSWSVEDLFVRGKVLDGLWRECEQKAVAGWDTPHVSDALRQAEVQMDRLLNARRNLVDELKRRQLDLMREVRRRRAD